MNIPLVSIIVPTKNSAATLEKCLESIKNQTYSPIELIVVDNNSTDSTKDIARKFTDKVFNKGPERSAQRNYGATVAKGEFVVFIDSDMELSKGVIKQCVEKMSADTKIAGIIIPEESFGEGFWAQCKKLERSFYVGVDWMEAARFFKREDFLKIGGYDENIVGAEDWDLSQRMGKLGELNRIQEFIYHNEGKISLIRTIRKKFYYAGDVSKYVRKNVHAEYSENQVSLLQRYRLFLSEPRKLFRDPLLGAGMLFMKTCEFGFGGLGYLISYIKKS